ncbi:arginase family enzyme [Saccharopolyspora lacisalsi]|uniref:Arginase family enzyme n=1 Tax=Halosaccharopolyspora lacisalsi TaxID=1000566 RepID=A0A839DTK0_9PSEU|nr:arginase family protein [Halosaccharopolyspora lacisalsi]MBA8823606.1 arginase family enzyme [Halosaccharopolyspora lacisalsi]
MDRTLTVFRGRAGDHNDRAMRGSDLVGAELARQLDLTATHVGVPEPALNADWETELAAALPTLRAMSAAYERAFDEGATPVAALTRCTVALATLPVVARYRPDACVVWFDAHADLNVPRGSPTGYLGGMAVSGAVGMWDSGLGGDLATTNIVLGGVRDIDPPEQRLIDEGTVRAVGVGPELASRLREAVAGRPVHFHIDCDVLEPDTVPTDHRVPGGMTLDDLRAVSGVVAEHEVVGVEIAEFEDAWSADGARADPAELIAAMRPVLDAAGG